MEDKELIEKFLNGNRNAFEILVKKYIKRVYWHARRMTGNHFDADEITQEVVLTLYQKLHTFKFNSELATWIFRITSNKTLNYIRKEKVRQFLTLDTVAGHTDNDIIKKIEDKEKLEKLNKILSKLPTKQREVFVFRQYDNLNYEEIAKVTGKSVGALKANYFHALKKIMDKMENE